MRCSMPACSTARRTRSASAWSRTIPGSRARRGSPSRIAASSIRAASKITRRMAAIRAWPRRLPSGRRRPSRRSSPPACAAAAARASPPASNGAPWPTTPPQQKYIVCNADEGDSGTFADRMIMEGDPFVLIEGMTIAGIAVGATYGYIYIRSEYPDAIEAMEIAIREARKGGMLGTRHRRLELRFRHGSAGRRRRLCVRRGNLAAREPRRQARRGPRQAAAPRPYRPVRQADRHQQRAVAGLRADHHERRRRASIAISAWASRAAPCRSSLPAISSMAGCTRRRSASRSAHWSTISAAARAQAARCAPCRSAARSAPISRASCSTRRSTTRRSPPPTG